MYFLKLFTIYKHGLLTFNTVFILFNFYTLKFHLFFLTNLLALIYATQKLCDLNGNCQVFKPRRALQIF